MLVNLPGAAVPNSKKCAASPACIAVEAVFNVHTVGAHCLECDHCAADLGSIGCKPLQLLHVCGGQLRGIGAGKLHLCCACSEQKRYGYKRRSHRPNETKMSYRYRERA